MVLPNPFFPIFFPPLLPRIINKLKYTLFSKKTERNQYGYFGNYTSWQEAYTDSSGYHTEVILEKVKTALLKVKNGEAVYERDSVLFDTIQYSWPLLAGLLRAASENQNRLSVLDFGGSLGSSYFQNRMFLSHLQNLQWSIVEQKYFVECGKENFEDERLCFYESIESCMTSEHPNVVILSSVLPYLEKPCECLKSVIETEITYIIVDRTPFLLNAKGNRLTIQKVHPSIYEASYPAWFFDKNKFFSYFDGKYQLIAEFDALAGYIYVDFKKIALDKGMIFKRVDGR
jgi:putative methyltransferase (TIGR04325 family)